jgi:transcriptional regulator NrdR family protein
MPAINVRCPECTTLRTRILSVFITDDGTGLVRRRRCLACNHRWYTHQPVEAEILSQVLYFGGANKHTKKVTITGAVA